MEAYRPIKTNHSVPYRSGSVDSGLGDKASLQRWRKMCPLFVARSQLQDQEGFDFVEPHSNCAVIRIRSGADVVSSTATVSRKLKLKVSNKTHRVMLLFSINKKAAATE